MTEKTDWELVDGPSPAAPAPTLQEMLRALLGRHWRWKLAGIAIVAALALTLVITLAVTVAGVAVVLLGAGALLSLAIAKLRRWIGREQRTLTPR